MRNSFRCLQTVVVLIALAGCGTPQAPNIRKEFGEGILRLGVTPFYPLVEGARLGQVYLVDASASLEKDGDPAAHVPTNVLLTEAAVPYMEAARSDQLAAKNRFPCSADNLSDQIGLTDQARSYYRQSTCAPPAQVKPDAKSPVSAAGAARAGEPVTDKGAAEGLLPLELAGIPSYSLASIDNISLAGSAPTGFANFLAAIGFRRSTSLRVEAEGVEVARLPAEQFAAAIREACNARGNPFSHPELAKPAMHFADKELDANAQKRQRLARKTQSRQKQASSNQELAYKPTLVMIKEVYYLRGIRYIFNDTRAYTALIEAAAGSSLKAASQPPVVPNISMNVVATPQPGAQPAKADAVAAEMAALQSQIDSLRSAVSSNANIQLGGTYARATARGIEFVELFQRPLAFGYRPIAIEYDLSKGYIGFCAEAGDVGKMPLSTTEKG